MGERRNGWRGLGGPWESVVERGSVEAVGRKGWGEENKEESGHGMEISLFYQGTISVVLPLSLFVTFPPPRCPFDRVSPSFDIFDVESCGFL